MSTKSIMECERDKIYQISKFKLPNYFKRIGLLLVFLSFTGLLFNGSSMKSETVRIFGRYGMLIGMLLVSISKEKIEDEMVAKLRAQSYTIAFIVGVIYALIQPIINYLFDVALDETPIFKDSGDFIILWFLLTMQICFFEMFKRTHK